MFVYEYFVFWGSLVGFEIGILFIEYIVVLGYRIIVLLLYFVM